MHEAGSDVSLQKVDVSIFSGCVNSGNDGLMKEILLIAAMFGLEPPVREHSATFSSGAFKCHT